MSSASGTGLFAALKNTAATLVGMLQTRLELVSNEIQIEKLRLLRQLALFLAVIFFGGLGLLLAVVLTTLLFWEQRIVLVAVFTALFLGLAGFFYAALRRSTDILSEQLQSTASRRRSVREAMRSATGTDRAGLEQR